ncbi:hypothetical protein HPB47_015299, partial [Ixodes persulcatus]
VVTYYILETMVGGCLGKSRRNRLRITKWDDFRASREASATETITNLEDWTSTLLTDIQLNTTDIPDEAHLEAIDARLLHLWEARSSLHKRWKTQRHNRNAHGFCFVTSLILPQASKSSSIDLINGPFSHTDGTTRWLHELKIEEVTYLRYQSIMGATLPVSSLSEQRRVANATRKKGICGVHPNVVFFFPTLLGKGPFLHQWPGTEDELLQELQSRYIGVPRTTSLPPYAGSSNPLLDSDITVPEVRAAVLQLHTNSTPGPDHITN